MAQKKREYVGWYEVTIRRVYDGFIIGRSGRDISTDSFVRPTLDGTLELVKEFLTPDEGGDDGE